MKTPITYYGGKQNLVSTIIPLIPDHKIYTEAFAGGLAIFFAKTRVKNEIINDNNGMVSNFYRVLVSDFDNLKKKTRATPYSRAIYKNALVMYELPHLFKDLELAWAFFVLTNIGFSGRIGSFGCHTRGNRVMGWENKKNVLTPELHDRLVGVQIECTDALKILKLRDTVETFHYVDPPYVDSNQGHYGGYTESHFAELLDVLSSLKGKFLLSSYPSGLLNTYIKKHGWYTKSISMRISAANIKNGNKQKTKTEVLTSNYPI